MTDDLPIPDPRDQDPKSRRRWLRWGALLFVAGTVGIAAIFGARLGRDPNLVDSPLIGTAASTRAVGYLEQPGTFSLKQFRGHVVVVNFWASWCVACRKEHPELIAAASAYQGAGVKFVGVDYQDQKQAAIGFLNEMGRGTAYTYLADPDSRLAIDFGVFGVPETFILDRNGRIVGKITGPSTLPLLAGTLDQVLAGRRPTPPATTGPIQQHPARSPR